jgi:hypothetical protein
MTSDEIAICPDFATPQDVLIICNAADSETQHDVGFYVNSAVVRASLYANPHTNDLTSAHGSQPASTTGHPTTSLAQSSASPSTCPAPTWRSSSA